MNQKIFLLISLLTIPASSLLLAEDDMYAVIDNIYSKTNNQDVSSESSAMPLPLAMPPQDISLNEKPQENTLLLEQRFMCEKETENDGVVCQMYECLNDDCHAATVIKTNDEITTVPIQELTTEELVTEDTTLFDFDDDESEILCPVIEKQKFSEPEEEMDDLIIKKITVSEPETEVMPDVLSEEILSNVDISPSRQQRINQLKAEIRQAERTCERAESDPREKAICEDASADVQWRKERIRELINQ